MPEPRPNLFADVDADGLHRVCEAIGTRFGAIAAIATTGFVDDPSISPDALVAGICRAHLLGAASALASAKRTGALTIRDVDAIARDAAAVIADTLREMV